MFKWYRGSALTIVYLRGVRLPSTRGDLVKSVWNTRAWTFQEYVAAEVTQFYTEDWSLYLGLNSPNHKDSLEIISEMEEATGVSAADLLALRPGLDNIRQKLCLASTRQTTLVEDAAYSLFGIFSTSIPVIYGEGESALGRLLGHVLTASGDVSILAWTGESSSYNSCLPAQITFYNVLAVSHPPSVPADSIERIIACTSPQDLELATRLYDQLNGLSSPWFVANPMKLSCMIFPLQSIKSSRAGELHIYRATTTIFGVVEIRTTADLSQLNPLHLVHPWISSLLDRDLPDSKKPVEEDVRPVSPCPDEDANGAFGSNTAPVHSESTDWRSRGLKIVNRVVKPFVGWFSPAGLHRSLPPPSAVAPGIDKPRRAIRLIARLREPFGLLLLTPLRAGAMEYRRVAADSMITVRMQENTPLTYLLDSVRSIEVL